MELNEIKKALYKQKPIAYLRHTLANGSKTYGATFEDGYVRFFVPVEEMGDTVFGEEMPSQLLIRWIRPHDNATSVDTNTIVNRDRMSTETLCYLMANGTKVKYSGKIYVYFPKWVEVVDLQKSVVICHNLGDLPEELIDFIKSERGEA